MAKKTVIDHLEAAKKSMEGDPRAWIKNAIQGLINRISTGGGAGSRTPVVKAMTAQGNVGEYGSNDPNAPLINTKKKRKEAVAAEKIALESEAEQAVLRMLAAFDDEQIKDHFVKLKDAKTFIIEQGGNIHPRATWDNTIAVMRSVLSVEDEEE